MLSRGKLISVTIGVVDEGLQSEVIVCSQVDGPITGDGL